MSTLHISNGDSTAGTLRETTLDGDHLSWREALVAGPNPAGLQLEDWIKVRARYFSEAYGVDINDTSRESTHVAQSLRDSSRYEEVVLWFEYDLFCQINLIFLLAWFSENRVGNRLSLICIDSFPGKINFRGLGELNAAELESLFPERADITKEMLEVGAAAWQAYCSSDPTDIESLLARDGSALPFLKTAMRHHIARFPSVDNGLGHVEHSALHSIKDGPKEFGAMFRDFWDAEPIYGFGDAQFWDDVKRLSNGDRPLLDISGDTSGDVPHQALITITEEGRAVLSNQADYLDLNQIDFWLGGVHLKSGAPIWRWNTSEQRLEQQ